MWEADRSELLQKLCRFCSLALLWTAALGRGLVARVAVIVAVVVTVGGGAVVEDVERDVARRWAEHQEATLTQRRLVAEVTEGTLRQTFISLSQAGGRRRPRLLRQTPRKKRRQRVFVL